jgi:hypothetical protein
MLHEINFYCEIEKCKSINAVIYLKIVYYINR